MMIMMSYTVTYLRFNFEVLKNISQINLNAKDKQIVYTLNNK
jgi:hypothetical protein